ncbi:fungal-specific transcription factor domain-containing protein [Biscogniauxia mediterranea]|nr:fungal-specific transcription factor domain-containing protein [Biscogniauxia mediterranea]
MHTPPVNARRRACDACFRRKIKCDGATPRCDWCKHHNLACTFSRPVRLRKGAKSGKQGHEASHESPGPFDPQNQTPPLSGPLLLHDGHDLSNLRTGHALSPSPATSSGSSPPPFGSLHFAGYHLGEVCSYNGMPLFSPNGQRWIQARTGDVPAFPKLTGAPWENKSIQEAFLHPVSNLELPDRKVTEEYFSMFCTRGLQFVFPVVDPVLFKDTIDDAYEPWEISPSIKIASAKACVLSFLSFVSLMEGTLESAPIDCDTCAIKAQHLLPQIFLENSIITAQVGLMQCIYHLFSGKLQAASIFHAMSCQMMFMLGAHLHHPIIEPPRGPGSTESRAWRVKTHLRKLFIMAYTFDKDISLRTGQPPVIKDEHCDITHPSLDEDIPTHMTSFNKSLWLFIPGGLQLSTLKSRTFELLHSAEALRKSDAQLLRDIRELDDKLEEWRIAIDPDIRPSLSCRPGDTRVYPEASFPWKMYTIITNFEYYHLVAAIHGTTGRCRAWSNGESCETEGVSSSLALCVEASRSTLIYLRAAIHTLGGESFWMILFYPMAAVLAIFCNILLKPLCPASQNDLELLNSAPELIRSLRTRRLSPHEITHMKMIEDFMAELTRLGTCAIMKAHREKNETSL